MSMVADLGAGFRAIVRIRALARATLTSVISCVGEGLLITCSPLIGAQALGGASRGVGLLSGMAASALAANAVLSRYPRMIPPETIIWCSTVVLAAALGLAATGRPALLIPAMVMAGAAEGTQLTSLFAVRHREAPGHLRGRIFTTGASLKITGFALGAGVAGPIATRSLTAALLTGAGCEVLAALAFASITLTKPKPNGR